MKFNTPIYLDNNSTTSVDPRVLDAMLPYFQDRYGNYSSNHSFGWITKSAVENARDIIAGFLNVSPKSLIFTSGATESINLVHLGLTENISNKEFHIISSNIEHSASSESLNYLLKKGFEISIIKSDSDGLIDVSKLESSITEKTKLVSLIFANNEIGTISDIKKIGSLCKENGILLHVDATQAVGKVPFNIKEFNIDLMSFTAHKLYGPKGIGCLYFDSGNPKIKINSRLFGGSQENSLRPGTVNVPAIVGFGKAVEICESEIEKDLKHTKNLRDSFYKNIVSNLDDIYLNGSLEKRLPNNINIRIEGVFAEKLFLEMRDIAFSASSACHSGSNKPSKILTAIGLNENQALSSVRFGFGRFNTIEEIDYASERIIQSVNKIRQSTKSYLS